MKPGLLLLLLVACNSGIPNETPRLTPGGKHDPISVTRGTRALVTPSRRFVAYVPAGQRLGVIDQATETEVYGLDVAGDVRAAFPVAKFDGVAALAGDGLTVFSEGLSRTFAFTYASGDWDVATEAPAFALAELGGVRVIRHLEGDLWQHALLPGLTPEGLDAPIIDATGTVLVLLRPEDGAYSVYRADTVSSEMQLTLTCPAPATLASPVVALALSGTKVFWGDAAGGVGGIDVASDACQTVALSAAVADGAEVARLVPRSASSVLVMTIGGGVYDWDGAAALTAYAPLSDCGFPLSPTPLDGDELAVLCLNDLAVAPTARTVQYSAAAYSRFALGTSAAQVSLNLIGLGVTAASVDASTKRLFLVMNSAIGRLKVVDLTTGGTHERRGLFVDGVLER